MEAAANQATERGVSRAACNDVSSFEGMMLEVYNESYST